MKVASCYFLWCWFNQRKPLLYIHKTWKTKLKIPKKSYKLFWMRDLFWLVEALTFVSVMNHPWFGKKWQLKGIIHRHVLGHNWNICLMAKTIGFLIKNYGWINRILDISSLIPISILGKHLAGNMDIDDINWKSLIQTLVQFRQCIINLLYHREEWVFCCHIHLPTINMIHTTYLPCNMR